MACIPKALEHSEWGIEEFAAHMEAEHGGKEKELNMYKGAMERRWEVSTPIRRHDGKFFLRFYDII